MASVRAYPPLMWLLALACLRPAAAAITPQQEKHFESHIRPVLVEHCIECHGPQKQKAGLRLDSREALLKGGESGSVVTPGQPEKSLLIELLHYEKEVRMPPKKKLPDATVEAWEQWVKMGLPWPGEPAKPVAPPANITPPAAPQPDRFAEARRTHWSLQPVVKHAPPAVKNAAAVANDIDSFIVARLESRGLSPSPTADRRTLIRRAYFDLIGLPPSYEEVEALVNDAAPDAWEKVIDRLLASPHYGERWGRHWLDVARYADTKGYVFTQDRRYPYSYTYRDYVIRAFNDDKPFDRFILEQIAADKLDLGSDKRALAAMGFLTVGRRFNLNTYDIIDDRIDVVTRGFLGLTVACARCHDHKYDPVTAEDYYALYGIFASSVEPEDLPLIEEPYPTPEYKAFAAELEKREKAIEDHRVKTRQTIEEELRSRAGDYLSYIARSLPNHNTGPVLTQSPRGELRSGAIKRWEAALDRAKQANDPIWLAWSALAALGKDKFGEAAAAVVAKLDGQMREGKITVNAAVMAALRQTPPQSMEDVAQLFGRLLEGAHQAWQEQLKAAAKDAGGGVPQALPAPEQEALRLVLHVEGGPTTLAAEDAKGLWNRAERDREKELMKKVEELKASNPAAPARAMVMLDAKQMHDPHVLLRGQPGNLGKRVDRRFLAVLESVTEGKPFKKDSGRLDLAKAIASPANPLTARVLVNRVWQQHFGAGFVRDASDLGIRTEAPVQRDLLDHLAATFVEQGWSIKKLHRSILLSRTWQQVSDHRGDVAAADPENQLWWRMNRRRLEFEPMRDSLLAVAGRLDPAIGGRPVDLVKGTNRRTVYGYIDRQDLPSLFRVFDLATPDASSPARPNTTVPQQALYLMNNKFIADQAAKLLERAAIAKYPGDTKRNIATLYQHVYSRSPDDQELALGQAFIQSESVGGEGKAWLKYVQALLMGNEFVFVD